MRMRAKFSIILSEVIEMTTVKEAVAAGADVLLPKYSLGGTCAIAYVGFKDGPQVEFFQD